MELSAAEIYHEATKYSARGFSIAPQKIDQSQQPGPASTGEHCERFSLADDRDASAGPLLAPRGEAALSRTELSRLLYFSAGVTGVLELPNPVGFGEPSHIALRAAPSAGGLYPTGVYVAIGSESELPQGLYSYDCEAHELAKRPCQDALGPLAKATGCPELFAKAPGALVLTGIFERSGWRYQDRAYRRVLLDTGHLLGNLALIAEAFGRAAIAIGGFVDQDLARLLMLDQHHEGSLLVIPLLKASPKPTTPPRRTLLSRSPRGLRRRPNASLMRVLHQASQIERPVTPSPGLDQGLNEDFRSLGARFLGRPWPMPAAPLDWSTGLERVILERRSARTLTGGPLKRSDLASLLSEAERGQSLVDPSLIETRVVIHNVDDLPSGVYFYDGDQQQLHLQGRGHFREQAAELCLGQELARDAAALVIHSSHLPRAVTRHGSRAYRYLHLEAGRRGQALNLTAVRLELGASGIGGFFDDELGALVGLAPRDAVLYVTVLGRVEG